MPDTVFRFDISGLQVVTDKLLAMAPTIRTKYARKALVAGAQIVQKVASTPGIVPVLAAPIYRRGVLIRKPGTVRDSIKIRNSKDVNKTGDVGVFVNVKPAQGVDRGRYNPNDNFYWKFLEFGTRYMRARPFLRIGGGQLEGPALEAVIATLAPDLQQLNLPGF